MIFPAIVGSIFQNEQFFAIFLSKLVLFFFFETLKG